MPSRESKEDLQSTTKKTESFFTSFQFSMLGRYLLVRSESGRLTSTIIWSQLCMIKFFWENRSKWVRGSPAHTLWSHKYTQAQFCIIFFSPTHTDWSHVRTPPFSRVTRAHRLESQVHTGTILHHFFHPESPTHTSHGIGWGGVGWDDDILLHLHTCSKRCAMDCFGTYFTHVM